MMGREVREAYEGAEEAKVDGVEIGRKSWWRKTVEKNEWKGERGKQEKEKEGKGRKGEKRGGVER